MATKESMNIDKRSKYLRMMKERYELADRRAKGCLLDEMEAMTGLHRKHLIARVNSPELYRKPRVRKRSRVYRPAMEIDGPGRY